MAPSASELDLRQGDYAELKQYRVDYIQITMRPKNNIYLVEYIGPTDDFPEGYVKLKGNANRHADGFPATEDAFVRKTSQ